MCDVLIDLYGVVWLTLDTFKLAEDFNLAIKL